MFKKIIVGISGGVDSAVSALLLKQKGFSLVGVFMKNWDLTNEVGHCTSPLDLKDAKFVCTQLDIPLIEVNFVKDYWNSVFLELLSDYENCCTPNPDVLCNKRIKFKTFIDYSLNKLGGDAIATGHYAQNSFGNFLEHYDINKNPKLLTAFDTRKDQTFFLHQISNTALRKTMFPLGNLKKETVKTIALENGLEKIAIKKESMGICFIGPRKFQNFIEEYIKPQNGNFIDIETNKIIGEHKGIHNWTIGQKCRKAGLPKSYYIVKKCLSNDIYVSSNRNHPFLYDKDLIIESPYWIHSEPPDLNNSYCICDFRFQHGKPLTRCTISKLNDNFLLINLDYSLRALTPGQYGVLYKNNECLGGGRIRYIGNGEIIDFLRNKNITLACSV